MSNYIWKIWNLLIRQSISSLPKKTIDNIYIVYKFKNISFKICTTTIIPLFLQ